MLLLIYILRRKWIKKPLVLAGSQKPSFDSNSLYRHPDVVALRDETEEDAK